MGNLKSSLKGRKSRRRLRDKGASPERRESVTGGYEIVLPLYIPKAWDVVYSGPVEPFRKCAEKYGFKQNLEQCRHPLCSPWAVCRQEMNATCSAESRKIVVKRYGATSQTFTWAPEVPGKNPITLWSNVWHSLPCILAVDQENCMAAVGFQFKDSLDVYHEVCILDLKREVIQHVLQPISSNQYTVVQADFSPDSTAIGILYWSVTTKFEFYVFSAVTGMQLRSTTQMCTSSPSLYFAFDTRYKKSSVGFISRGIKEGRVMNLLQIYSVKQNKVIQETEFAPYCNTETGIPIGPIEVSALSFSTDGQFIFAQTFTKRKMTYGNYIFAAAGLHFLKFLLLNMTNVQNICSLNRKPSFSKCCSIVKFFNQTSKNEEKASAQIKVYKLPLLDSSLQFQCRKVILQSLKSKDDVRYLPVPSKLKNFLKFVSEFD